MSHHNILRVESKSPFLLLQIPNTNFPNLFTQQQSPLLKIMEIIKLSLCLFLLFNCCFSQIEQQQSFLWQKLQQQQQHRRGRAKTDCRISNINAREPTLKYNSEAGTTEFWDQNSEEFKCAGVAAVRNDIQPKGLLLPHYNNAPQLLYIVQGLHFTSLLLFFTLFFARFEFTTLKLESEVKTAYYLNNFFLHSTFISYMIFYLFLLHIYLYI